MVHLSSVLAAGLVGVLAWDFYAAPRALDATTDASVVASADVVATVRTGATPATAVDRTLKGDRLLRMPDGNSARPEITKVEIGPGEAILLRDRAGSTLFSVDPTAQRTIIAKNVALPQLTLQTTARGPAPEAREPAPAVQSPPAVDREPSRTTVSTGRKPEAKRPAGCDPAFSPITAPELAHIFGRCVTSIEAPTRLASAQ